jgi:thymidylate kinase
MTLDSISNIITVPKLIVLEGNTSVGKSTLARGIVDSLNENEVSAVYRKAIPSEKNRDSILELSLSLPSLEEDMLYVEDLYGLIEEANDLISSGITVVMDRYIASKLSYSEVHRSNTEYQQLLKQIDFSKIPTPDLMFYLHASNEIKHQRLGTKTDASAVDLQTIDDPALELALKQESEKLGAISINTGLFNQRELLDYCVKNYILK